MFQWFSKKLNQKRKGFTLIELVVVIAILGLLAALAIPRLSGSRDNAARKSILANLRTIDSAISIAQADTGITATTIAQLTTAKDLTATPPTLGVFLATSPNNVAGETYGIAGGRATITGVSTLGLTAATTYTLDDLLLLADWKN